MLHSTCRIAALLGAAALGATACTSLLGDFTVGNGTTGTGGAGGSTTASTTSSTSTTTSTTTTTTTTSTTTSTTSTTSTTTSTTSTTTGGMMCTSSKDCVALETDCFAPICKPDGTCAAEPRQAGTEIATQVKGDCKKAVCDGAGNVSSKDDATDIEDDGNPCTTDACAGSSPSHTPVAMGMACQIAGNPAVKVCNITGTCVECLSQGDCVNTVCQGGLCVAATCTDGIKDGGETDIDCGGGQCVTCKDGKACATNSDCESKICPSAMHLCKAATCGDGVKNQDETSTDCGGLKCSGCSAGSTCLVNSDCQSDNCSANFCQSSPCENGMQDGDETDTDCGGLMCSPCDIGSNCIFGSDCKSNFCDFMLHICQ